MTPGRDPDGERLRGSTRADRRAEQTLRGHEINADTRGRRPPFRP
jgi:hypothetical protein